VVVLLIVTNVLRERMSMADPRAALGEEGVASMSEGPRAILEDSGVSVVHRGAQAA
jgi:uncharacterized membrane protein YcaP (DUF421 family)